MSGSSNFKKKDVVRIKVKLCNGAEEPLYKQFSCDPCVTSYNVLLRILARAFSISSDFDVSYLATDHYGDQFYLPLTSEWDLDAAILTASEPVLRMKVEIRAKEAGLEDWDIVVPSEVPSHQKLVAPLSPSVSPKHRGAVSNSSIFSHFTHHMGRSVTSRMQRALEGMKIVDSEALQPQWKPVKSPMSDAEYKNFMDNLGRLVMPREFKHSVFLGGLDASLRKVGWRALLDLYPPGCTGTERLHYLRQQTYQYFIMKNLWKKAYARGCLSPQQITLIAAISVDAVRTDRSHSFFATEELSNSKISQLFDLLVTYSLYHPSVGYSQGMSDLASPLLFVQGGDEGAAYVCFCALMRRLKSNFSSQGKALITKLQHLHDLLVYYDAPFAASLRERGLGDMFFAHRWLLLELKREFHFDDVLRLFELQWAAIPPDAVQSGWDPTFTEKHNLTAALLEVEMSEDAFTYSWNDESSFQDDSFSSQSSGSSRNHVCLTHHYSGHDLRLINSLVGKEYEVKEHDCSWISSRGSDECCISSNHTNLSQSNKSTSPIGVSNSDSLLSISTSPTDFSDFDNSDVSCKENAPSPSEINESSVVLPESNNCQATPGHGLVVLKDGVVELPPPSELGHGNPFLLFLCLSLLLEYREPIMRHVYEMFDFSVFFRRINHNHNVNRIIGRARCMFNEYLNDQETRIRRIEGFPELQVSL